jgi:hypothetical protein
VINCYFRRFRHAVAIGKTRDMGVPRNIVIANCVADKTTTTDVTGVYDIHPTAEYITYIGNIAHCGPKQTGFTVSGYNCTIANNIVYGGGGITVGYGISNLFHTDNSADLNTKHIITGNQIIILPQSDYHGIVVATNGCTIVGNQITILSPPNIAPNVGTRGISLQQAQSKERTDKTIDLPITDTLVTNNKIFQGAQGIEVWGGKRIQITNNQIFNIGMLDNGELTNAYGIYLRNNQRAACDGIDITGNNIFDDSFKTNVGIYSDTDPIKEPVQPNDPGIHNRNIYYAENQIILNRSGNVPIFVPAVDMGSRRFGSSVFDDSIVIGKGGVPITNILASRTRWSPGHLEGGKVVSTTISILGAAPGDPAIASHDQIGALDVILSAHVQSRDGIGASNVRVVLQNVSGVPIDISEGSLSVMVWKHA